MKSVRKKQDEEEIANNRVRALEAEVEDLKKKAGSLAKDRLLREKAMKKLQMQKDKESPAVMASKEEMARVTRRIKSGEKAMTDLKAKEKEQHQLLRKLETDLQAVHDKQAALEAEVKAHYARHASKASKMGSADVAAEYQRIKADVATKTAKISAECDALQAQLQADEKALLSTRNSQAALVGRGNTQREGAAKASSRADELRTEGNELQKQIKAAQAELKQGTGFRHVGPGTN
eukprot:362070-Chlamydomonas_euryale.AAC.23